MPAGPPMRPGPAPAAQPIETRFVLWFNGNGIVEKYWIRAKTVPDYEMTPCLQPLARYRQDIHVLSGIDNPAARLPGPGNGHHNSMSGLVSGEMFSGRGAGGPSIDQVIAQQIGDQSRFRSLQIGVCQESFGESIQRNMSWAGRDRPLPPEMIPQRLFDRLFGSREPYWIERKKSILDAVSDEARSLKSALGTRRSAAARGIPGLGAAAWSVRSRACRPSMPGSWSSRRKAAI